jgi:hypothetical protein
MANGAITYSPQYLKCYFTKSLEIILIREQIYEIG